MCTLPSSVVPSGTNFCSLYPEEDSQLQYRLKCLSTPQRGHFSQKVSRLQLCLFIVGDRREKVGTKHCPTQAERCQGLPDR